jgi:hypothetical protein
VTGRTDPEEIQQEIEATREELGDTVAALAAKTDVKRHVKQKLQDAKQALGGKRDQLAGAAKDASPETATTIGNELTVKARENPVAAAAAGGFALGLLTAWIMRR